MKIPDSFNYYLLSTHYVAGAVADAGAIAVSKVDKNGCFCGAGILMGKTDNKHNREFSILESGK